MTNIFTSNNTLRSLASAVAALGISAMFLVAAAGPAVAAPRTFGTAATAVTTATATTIVATNSVNSIPNSNIVRGG
ncbi:MAG: hypothetical protein RL480_105 [Pseudomonadota bacterium]|jgi:hypothetical protein